MSFVQFGEHDERTVKQLQRCQAVEDGALGVLCADGHVGYGMPIGGVIAYRDAVTPAGVGFDIGCGNCAVRTDVQVSDVDVPRVMDEVWRVISFGVGRANGEEIEDHPVFEAITTSPVHGQRKLIQIARNQLGTVGSGNHYVDLFEDRADGRLWVGVHFGSRGFGHKTATGFLGVAQGKTFEEGGKERGMDDTPDALDLRLPSGQDYMAAMRIAGDYAYAGRNWVVDRVLKILGAQDTKRVHNHHNFAWYEGHDDVGYCVIRKGATPAFPGQEGFVGGSMGDDAVIIVGRDGEESREALYSTVHGAGRRMGRRVAAGKTRHVARWRCLNYRQCSYTAAKGGYHKDEGGPTPTCPQCGHKLRLERMEEQLTPGKVDWAYWLREMTRRGIELRGGGADEAPECYKRLDDVLAAHGETIQVTHRLRPVGVAMADKAVVDPYKD